MLKKLKSRAALTLTELLVTTLILSMFSVACLTGISTAYNLRRQNVRIGDADILSSIAMQLISSELRVSLKADPAGESITYQDTRTKLLNNTLKLDGDNHLIKVAGDEENQLINEATYKDDVADIELYLDNLYFKLDDDKKDVIVCKFEIRDKSNDNLVKEVEFKIYPINGTKESEH